MRLTLRLLRHSVPRNDKKEVARDDTPLCHCEPKAWQSRRGMRLPRNDKGAVRSSSKVLFSPKSTARGYCINILKVASII